MKLKDAETIFDSNLPPPQWGTPEAPIRVSVPDSGYSPEWYPWAHATQPCVSAYDAGEDDAVD